MVTKCKHLSLTIKLVGNSTLEVSAEVVNITSDSEELTAADISATSAVVDQLTTEAIENPQVYSTRPPEQAIFYTAVFAI